MTRGEFDKFLETVYDAALNVVARILQSPRDSVEVREAVQRAATYFVERIEAGRAVKITKSYFIQKAKNCALDAIKAERTRQRILQEAIETEPFRVGWRRGALAGHQTAHTVGRRRYIRDDDPEDCLGENESDSFAADALDENNDEWTE